MNRVDERYTKRQAYLDRLIKKQDKNINRLSNLRFICAIAAIITFTVFFRAKSYNIAAMCLAGYVILFIVLVIIHKNAKKQRKRIEDLKNINLDSLKRLDGTWGDFVNDGEEFKEEDHPYASDLDIFGKGSLYQFINVASTKSGRNKLADFLKNPDYDLEEIKSRQDAVKELAPMLYFRQRMELEGKGCRKGVKDDELILWAKEKNELYLKSSFKWVFRILPACTILSAVLAYGFNLVPSIIFKTLVIVQAIILYVGSSKRNKVLGSVDKNKSELKAYQGMLAVIEKQRLKSEYLVRTTSSVKKGKGESASSQLRKLNKLSENIANRGNMMFLPINILLLWDYQCMFGVEKWKREYGKNIEKWLEAIGEVEALSSLAGLLYNHPTWCIPSLTKERSIYEARGIAHPLYEQKQVKNDIHIDKNVPALLITGSNMSGKSTYMRTAGINLILAYAGGPVCAESMRCSIMNVCTCMRIGDNLEKNISSFYAEILRISMIVKKCSSDRQVFFILDEIFKGTNSMDRHTGAEHVIKQLINDGASGMISTHDLELADMEDKLKGRIKNFHFEEYYKDDKIYFDYKLRTGVSKTRNALFLIRMAGIRMDS